MGVELVFIILGWVAIGFIGYTMYTAVNLQASPLDTKLPVAEPAPAPAAPAPVAPPPVAQPPPRPVVPTSSHPRFLFFYVNWCPWSKKAKQPWDAFVRDFQRFPSTYGGKLVSLELIDGDQQRDMIKAYSVNAYPTFKLVTSQGVTEMTGYPSPDAFKSFLIKSLGPEEPAKLT